MTTHLQQLKERLAEVSDIATAQSVLSWDQHTYMPGAGSGARAEQLATLQKLSHRMFTSQETRQWLDGAEAELASLPEDSLDRSLVVVTRRDMTEALKLPEELVAERTRISSLALEAWTEARKESRFDHFAPWLQQILDLEKRVAECRGYEGHPYDALIDAYEPGARTEQVAAMFAELRARLAPLARRIASASAETDDFLNQDFPIESQRELCSKLAAAIGYDLSRGRMDPTVHPFATSFSRWDVRITTRYDQFDPSKALFASLHEAGHAIYEQGMPEEFERTPLRGGTSLGVHESQSRMWENLVGRSRGFWEAHLADVAAQFPGQLKGVTVDRFYRAVNRVKPSFIRVEADEVTYNLHVLLRFEMELELLDGRLAIADAPEAWNSRMFSHLGITPPDDRQGILQDVHWSMGIIGYFPTYTLGNLLACQLWESAVAAHPSIPDGIRRGDTSELLGWLRENVHRYGRQYLPADLVVKATGKPLTAAPFLRYLEKKYTDLYNLKPDNEGA